MVLSTREIVLAALFTALMCTVTIMVRVFQPLAVLPFSLQPLIMLLAAYMLSPRAAFLSMLAYLLMGLMGLPVFSLPPYGGLAYVLLPSFGFILAFPLGAWLQSRLIYSNYWWNLLVAGLAGCTVYYLLGLPYMYMILKLYLGQEINVRMLLQIGLIPFVFFDLLKIIAAAVTAREVSRRLGWHREQRPGRGIKVWHDQ